MPLNRLRLRLAAGFALAFGSALVVLAAGAVGYLWRESTRRLDGRLSDAGRDVARAMEREWHESPDSGFRFVVGEVVLEWPANGASFVVRAPSGETAGTGPTPEAARVVAAHLAAPRDEHLTITHDGDDLRALVFTATSPRPYTVIAFGTTEGIEGDTSLAARSLALAVPLILLFSGAAGYLLSGRELRRNRTFLLEAAHQIRTPLTLVLGEAGHALDGGPADTDRSHAALGRIRTAAEQMRRRVDELFLLAEAEAGERIRLEDDVELDGLALECTDLMRARATALGRTLALGTIEPVVVRGNARLLREALLELLENGCRHGGAGTPVTTSVQRGAAGTVIEVSSATSADAPASTAGNGLGAQIVRWIAEGHGGTFDARAEGATFRARITLP